MTNQCSSTVQVNHRLFYRNRRSRPTDPMPKKGDVGQGPAVAKVFTSFQRRAQYKQEGDATLDSASVKFLRELRQAAGRDPPVLDRDRHGEGRARGQPDARLLHRAERARSITIPDKCYITCATQRLALKGPALVFDRFLSFPNCRRCRFSESSQSCMCCVPVRARYAYLVPHCLLVALRSPPRLSSRLCCNRRCLNLACLHASPCPQHTSLRHTGT